jgi:hypothetical protein
METAKNILSSIKERTADAAGSLVDLIKNTGSSVGSTTSSTFDSGITTFKSTSLGDTFFKNIPEILITVIILIGGIMYIDFLKANLSPESSTTVNKIITIEPNTPLHSSNRRYIPTDEGWTAPILSIERELTEGFGSSYSEKELENIHTKCSDEFCVLHNKSPKDLEYACNTISDKNLCAAKCCCGWTKYIGYEAENDPISLINKATATVTNTPDKKDGKCVAGNSKSPLLNYDMNKKAMDMEYYYYMNKCVNGRGCNGN